MIIEKITEYLSLCPLFEGVVINSDFLSENPFSCAVYAENEEMLEKKYAGGDALYKFIFSIRARMPISQSPKENKKLNIFFEALADWLENETAKGNLPKLKEDKEVQSMEILKQGHLKNTNVSDCVYEMRIKLLYYKGGNR